MINYTKFYLNHAKTRWCFLGPEGEKSKVHLKTKSGKHITRAAQYYEAFRGGLLVQISYKGEKCVVGTKTILKD